MMNEEIKETLLRAAIGLETAAEDLEDAGLIVSSIDAENRAKECRILLDKLENS